MRGLRDLPEGSYCDSEFDCEFELTCDGGICKADFKWGYENEDDDDDEFMTGSIKYGIIIFGVCVVIILMCIVINYCCCKNASKEDCNNDEPEGHI